MERISRVNVWFDRPGDFVEIGWKTGCSVNGFRPPACELGLEVHLTADYQATGFYILGALLFADRYEGHSVAVADVQPHPITIKYDRPSDLWDIQWGSGIVDCVDTPNPRIRANVDAEGQIQGVLLSDLRTFEGEILNQDLHPMQPGRTAA